MSNVSRETSEIPTCQIVFGSGRGPWCICTEFCYRYHRPLEPEATE